MPMVWTADVRMWEPTAWAGVEVCHMLVGPAGSSGLFRLRAGAVIPMHDHPRGEHTVIVEGELRFGDLNVRQGDILWTRPGEAHEVRALTAAIFFGYAPP
jgi:quercetin dioxygenase-like cupin family protein